MFEKKNAKTKQKRYEIGTENNTASWLQKRFLNRDHRHRRGCGLVCGCRYEREDGIAVTTPYLWSEDRAYQ
jgi:hypothetical protein